MILTPPTVGYGQKFALFSTRVHAVVRSFPINRYLRRLDLNGSGPVSVYHFQRTGTRASARRLRRLCLASGKGSQPGQDVRDARLIPPRLDVEVTISVVA